MPNEAIISVLLAFLGGGVLCALAQLLIDLTRLTPARILVCYVCLGVLLYATGVYDLILPIFGAGVSLPLIGFGAVIGKGVVTAVDTEGPIGILTGGLTASAAGITAALILGLLISFLCRGKPKRM